MSKIAARNEPNRKEIQDGQQVPIANLTERWGAGCLLLAHCSARSLAGPHRCFDIITKEVQQGGGTAAGNSVAADDCLTDHAPSGDEPGDGGAGDAWIDHGSDVVAPLHPPTCSNSSACACSECQATEHDAMCQCAQIHLKPTTMICCKNQHVIDTGRRRRRRKRRRENKGEHCEQGE